MRSNVTDYQFDWDRERRTGLPEAVLCSHKTAAQIDTIVGLACEAGQRLLLTRLDPGCLARLPPACRDRIDYEALSRTAILGEPIPDDDLRPGIGIVAAGTADMPVGLEAARTLGFLGFAHPVIADVGIAGLWRLMDRLDEIRALKIVIAVAGMEGALFSVIAGLVEAPLIAVPTSIGYGVSAGGRTALDAALGSCAPGVLTVNIDNGFGAAQAAVKIMRVGGRASEA